MHADYESSSRSVELDGVHLHYHDTGAGDPLILLHGGGPGASAWGNFKRNIGRFAATRRVLAIDLPNFGRSSKVGPVSPLYAYHADIVRRFMDAIGLDRAAFIGNSLGGGVALKLALEHPARTASLILMGPGGGAPIFSGAPSEGMKAIFACYDAEGPTREKVAAFVKLMVFDQSQITNDLLEDRLQAGLDPEVLAAKPFNPNASHFGAEHLWKADLSALTNRVLLICGREDRVMPFDTSLIYARQIPNARFVLLPRCGHWAQWERADEFNSICEEFLSGESTE